jgi:hypothetical protein
MIVQDVDTSHISTVTDEYQPLEGGEKAQTFCRRQRAQAFIRLVACMALRDCWAQHCILGAVFGLSSDE